MNTHSNPSPCAPPPQKKNSKKQKTQLTESWDVYKSWVVDWFYFIDDNDVITPNMPDSAVLKNLF